MRIAARLTLALAAGLVLSGCNQAPSPSAEGDGGPEPDVQLQALIEAGVAAGVPGVAAAVADRSGIIWAGTAGLADIDAQSPVRQDMLFGIGSITKVFVAVVVLQLVEEGALDLGDTVAGVLGDAADGIPNAASATIEQLLNHTSGIPSWEDEPMWIREGRGAALDVDHVWEKTETLDYIRGHSPLAPAGEAYSYANTNFTLLGMAIEEVTGNSAVAEIHTRVLDPLSLDHIRLEGFEPVPPALLPHRYHWATEDFQEAAGIHPSFPAVGAELIDASTSNLSVEWTAGGMVASATDLARFMVALRDGQLLSKESMATLTAWRPVRDGVDVGHNVFRYVYPDGHILVGHGGSVLGFTGSTYWIDGADVAVAVVANVGTMHSGSVPASASSIARDSAFVHRALEWAESRSP